MREKTVRLEKDITSLHEDHKRDLDIIREEQKEFVTHKHLDTVIEPMQRALEVLSKDVKEILRVVSSSHRPKS